MKEGAALSSDGSLASNVAGEARSPLREPGVLQRMVCALFAWAVTVAPFAFSRAGGWAARGVAVVALLAGVLGPLLVPSRRRVGRHVGISAFLALTASSWLLLSPSLDVARVDLVLAVTGSVAWMVFAFSWGEPWRFRPNAETEDLGASLRARAQLPSLAVPIAGVGVLCAAALVVLAFQVRDSSRALLAQVCAVGLGAAMVTVAGNIAVGRGKSRAPSVELPKSAVRALLMLAGAALLGAALLILRRD